MDFRLTPEQEQFKMALRAYCEQNIAPISREIDEQENGIPDGVIKGLAEMDVFKLTLPEEYGGLVPGEEMVYANLAIQEIARAEMSMSVPVYVLLCLGWGFLIGRYGTKQLKDEVLPKVASGDYFVGINVTEPGGGSDVAGIKTSAVHEGDHFVVNGEKAYISGPREVFEQRNGGHITLVRTDPEKGHKGFTFLYIQARLEGTGYTYKNVKGPDYCVLVEEGRGFYLNMEGFNAARVLVSAACVGMAEKALELSRDYVSQRVLFGQPLAKFEGISFEIADDHSKLEQLKLYLQYAAWAVDQHYLDKSSFTQRELSRIISICKMEAPMLATNIARRAMMHHGAFGYTKESPLEMALRGAMSYVVGAEGGYHIQKLIIAREYIGDVAVPYR
jgi:acyl-CoA dehydrogenase